MIADPPEEIRKKLDWPEAVNAVDLLLKPAEEWFPSLAPGMTRLAVSVPRWQLGRDRERFLSEFGDLASRIEAIRESAAVRGLDIRLGLAWDWLEPVPHAEKPAGRFAVFVAAPPLARGEPPGYVGRARRGPF